MNFKEEYLSFISKFSIGNQNKKASTLYLSKEANSKDLQLKSQMVLSLTDGKSKGSEKIWKEFGFYKDQLVELTISKTNFPVNCLVYINQDSLPVVKGGEKAYILILIYWVRSCHFQIQIQSLILITTCLKKMRSLFTLLFIINQLEYMAVFL